jgi:hypothetical protein
MATPGIDRERNGSNRRRRPGTSPRLLPASRTHEKSLTLGARLSPPREKATYLGGNLSPEATRHTDRPLCGSVALRFSSPAACARSDWSK